MKTNHAESPTAGEVDEYIKDWTLYHQNEALKKALKSAITFIKFNCPREDDRPKGLERWDSLL